MENHNPHSDDFHKMGQQYGKAYHKLPHHEDDVQQLRMMKWIHDLLLLL